MLINLVVEHLRPYAIQIVTLQYVFIFVLSVRIVIYRVVN